MSDTPAQPSPGPSIEELSKALSAPFEPGEIKFKPAVVSGNRALALAYVDARVIQDRLDDVLGVLGWQDNYKFLPDGSVVCRLRIRIGGDWITKVDVGGPSEQPDGGDRLKAAVSDSLKRAAVKFGIGRYLYRLPQQWVDYDPQRRQFTKPPQLPAWALPGKKDTAAKSRPATHTMPADGAELQKRLQDYEAKLVKQGLCAAGSLLEHVKAAGAKAGHGGDMTKWAAAAIELAAQETKAFEAQARKRQAEAEVQAPTQAPATGAAAAGPDNGELVREIDMLLVQNSLALPTVLAWFRWAPRTPLGQLPAEDLVRLRDGLQTITKDEYVSLADAMEKKDRDPVAAVQWLGRQPDFNLAKLTRIERQRLLDALDGKAGKKAPRKSAGDKSSRKESA